MTVLAAAPNRTFCRTIGSASADHVITDDYAEIDMMAPTGNGVAIDFAAGPDIWL